MKKLKRVWVILRMSSADKIVIGFFGFMLLISFLLQLVEPSMESYGDALWYSFSVVTTIGFGDYTATTLIGRGLSILLGIYGLLVVALIPGILVSYYMEFVQRKADTSIAMFLEQLEHLDELSKEELRELSQKVKKHRYKDE